ncbi:tRNA-dihydrouridine(20a/20b) synthase [NAD(P)+]-like protein [Kappamyces sp. JEL0680]|nr:tRNA-dihydrouridine(20a/20b) synthase [NAD(P)+]-like protein [Kappamyces sp. JEL0680]
MERVSPLSLLDAKQGYLNIAAPMVRYSKLPFRDTVRKFGVDLCYTPMILADVFRNSSLSREAELTTSVQDTPLVVQFAASNARDAADAAEMVARHTNGVDINCGCPQPWAYQEGIGSFLLTKPEIVQGTPCALTIDIVDQIKRRTAPVKMADGSSFPCSIKIRIDKDLKKTVELCRRAEKVGADWITVHGRVRSQKNEGAADLDAIQLVSQSLGIPVFGNGGITSIAQADAMVRHTGAKGVMVAQGLLENPALFAGYEHTPLECVKEVQSRRLIHD